MQQRTVEARLAGLLDDREVTEDGTEPGIVDAPSAWRRGARWGRRRRIVAVASVAACVALLGAVVWTVPMSLRGAPELAPADAPSTDVQVPARLWDTPSRAPQVGWGVPVVAVQEAPRSGWFGSESAVAVRTQDGRQGFVPAPDYAGEVTLSPDGRLLAYWITGATSDTPKTSFGQATVVTGVAVRDVVDGTLRTHDFTSPHGLSTRSLYFASADLLVADAGAWLAGDDGDDMARSSSSNDGGVVWDLSGPARAGGAAPTAWEDLFGDDVAVPDGSFSFARDGILTQLEDDETADGERHRIVEYAVAEGRRTELGLVEGTLPSSSAGTPPVMVDAGRLYVVGDLRRAQSPNSVTVVGEAQGDARVVPGTDDTLGFLGVRDGALLVTRLDVDAVRIGDSVQDVVMVDVDGARATAQVLVDVVSAGDDTGHGHWQWARDVLEGAPSGPGSEPVAQTSPWLSIGAGALALVLVLGGAGTWWRRARP